MGHPRAHGNLADKFGITVPSDRAILDSVPKYRSELVDTCLEQDDAAMEAFLDGTEPSVETLKAPASARAPSTAHSPLVLCGSSYKNKGVQQMLDAVVDYLPCADGRRSHRDGG